ncbi:ubiquitin-conjugating enzyme E2-like protein, putative [Bodo saltans]|uniref:Ubiquitin-conjugating enzyme E2-like protein, putative n=1 Tax=Bodo saltans TaxID=75058 RepID=A0A0S4IMA4_BODSA|nr:ubiquitin-conjugating enzyme E2-like protein, putative [Bodo saltans]CUF41595.1 ubiquitin-conjugating enzyme E2-like protein, putative [Bodo saltans]|eukprot:CUF41050.1 ubiquitin-conjugating enzyme E2-like protein, putative [Bodo saltans]
MPHLFDENALEQQEPLRRQGRQGHDSASSQSGEGGSEETVDYDAVEYGDFVAIRTESANEVPIYGVVMPPEDVIIHRGMHPPSTVDWVPVWFVCPTHCGDPQQLFQYVPEDELRIVDRPVDLNTIVVDRETLDFGIVRSQQVTFAALPLEKLLNYQRENRHSTESSRMTLGLSLLEKKTPVRFQPWYKALQKHQRAILNDPELQQATFSGHCFVRANPFFIGQHVRSIKRCVPIEVDDASSASDDEPINNLIMSSSPNSSNNNDADSMNQNNSDDEQDPENNCEHFSGHVRGVSYSALVELMLPPHIQGSRGSEQDHQQFLIMIPPEVIESSVHDDISKRHVLFRNVRNFSRLEALYHGDYVETADDTSVAPSQMDLVSPLMYAEEITMEALETRVLWVRGTFEEYRQELERRLSSNNGSKKKAKRTEKGGHKKRQGAAEHAADDNDESPTGRCGNGIVVFSFAEVITAIDFRTNLPRDFKAYEIVSIETSGSDNAFAGQYGFALSPEDALFDRARNVQHLDSGAAAGSVDRALSGVQIMAPTDDVVRWYREHGILVTSREEQNDWFTRLQKLHKALDKLVWITSSLSNLSVIWKESGEITAIDSEKVASGERSYRAVRDVFPMDIVLPQTMYATSSKLNELAAASEAERGATGTLIAPVMLLADAACPIHDIKMIFDYGTDFQPGESVVPRENKERFVVEGDELTFDPKILGRVVSANTEDETCSVVWYLQPDLTDAELIARRPHDVGQVVELLPDTYVRILWSDGTVEDLPRVMLEPVRAAGAGDHDDEEDEESESDDIEDVHDAPQPSEESHHPPDSNVASHEGESWFQRLKRGVTELVASSQNKALNTVTSERESAGETEQPLPVSPVDVGDLFPTVFMPTTSVPACEVVSMFSKHIFQQEDGTEPRLHGNIFLKRTQREWKDIVARIDVPLREAEGNGNPATACSTMFVKCCSSAPELVKFVIIGALHTPYYQSFLAFDLYYPPTFPIEPPSVRFHSYNLRLNPNLYVDGYICLSLLGTWSSGDSTETWLPATSSVMQILLSLQSLVLVKEPYYNEAGYDEYRGTPMGRIHSKTYNENLALLRIQHLIAMAESPPPDWVFAFRQYFLSTAPRIAARLSRLADQQEAAKLAPKNEDSSSAMTNGDEGISADGLVLPLSKGFIHSLRRHIELLNECIVASEKKWKAEEEAVLNNM